MLRTCTEIHPGMKTRPFKLEFSRQSNACLRSNCPWVLVLYDFNRTLFEVGWIGGLKSRSVRFEYFVRLVRCLRVHLYLHLHACRFLCFTPPHSLCWCQSQNTGPRISFPTLQVPKIEMLGKLWRRFIVLQLCQNCGCIRRDSSGNLAFLQHVSTPSPARPSLRQTEGSEKRASTD